MGLFDKLKQGLAKTRKQLEFVFTKIDDDLYDELEEQLIMADVGAQTASGIIESLRERVKEEKITDGVELPRLIREIVSDIMRHKEPAEETENGRQKVKLIIGVNGAGKTTTVGKLANYYREEGKTVLIAAADTFRAAAVDQLQVWADRAGVAMIRQGEGADPAAVVFDAANAARARGVDVLLCDTAGRLHNKKNLMDELAKIARVVERELPDAEREVLLVLDATTGQNALSQAKLFNEVTSIDGIILTKLDGTAKGGAVIAISAEQEIPVRFVGIGEGIDDLLPFSERDYVEALFSSEG